MGHMINRQSQAFSCNSGNNCTRNRLNCTRLRLVQLAVACAIIPELHSKACDYLYKLHRITVSIQSESKSAEGGRRAARTVMA